MEKQTKNIKHNTNFQQVIFFSTNCNTVLMFLFNWHLFVLTFQIMSTIKMFWKFILKICIRKYHPLLTGFHRRKAPTLGLNCPSPPQQQLLQLRESHLFVTEGKRGRSPGWYFYLLLALVTAGFGRHVKPLVLKLNVSEHLTDFTSH